MAGAKEGENGHIILRPGTDRETITGAVYEQMKAQDVIVNNSGGGGGWGDPLRRDPQKVLEDVRNDYVSIRRAREDYGVIIQPDPFELDLAATNALRRQLA
jgi:N-methylhydantoinase B